MYSIWRAGGILTLQWGALTEQASLAEAVFDAKAALANLGVPVDKIEKAASRIYLLIRPLAKYSAKQGTMRWFFGFSRTLVEVDPDIEGEDLAGQLLEALKKEAGCG